MARPDEVHTLASALMHGRLGRREFLTRAAALGLSAPVVAGILAACGASATPTSAPAAQATTAPTAATGGGAGGAATAAATRPAAAGASPAGQGRTGITTAEWNPEKIKA